jgi:2-(1,2-epoxy-1,2-dihydrophenyl)acetyl-CoA isomerase
MGRILEEPQRKNKEQGEENMGYESIIVKKVEKVATVVMNRPEALNFLDPIMALEIEKALADFDKDEGVRAVIITGAGRAFCAGGDVKFMQQDWPVHELVVRMERVTGFINAMLNLPKPIIASVNGPAVGGGCNIALAADLVFASEKATFSQVFTRIGLIPDCGGVYLLPRRVGMTKAKELIFTGRTVDAQEAERIGLVNRVFPAEALEEETRRMAVEMANGPTMALGIAKRLLNQSYESDFETILRAENSHQVLLRKAEDHREGVQAFFEKRKPEFKGR